MLLKCMGISHSKMEKSQAYILLDFFSILPKYQNMKQ